MGIDEPTDRAVTFVTWWLHAKERRITFCFVFVFFSFWPDLLHGVDIDTSTCRRYVFLFFFLLFFPLSIPLYLSFFPFVCVCVFVCLVLLLILSVFFCPVSCYCTLCLFFCDLGRAVLSCACFPVFVVVVVGPFVVCFFVFFQEEAGVLPKEGDEQLPTKRRRFNVDYVALQKKLQVELNDLVLWFSDFVFLLTLNAFDWCG